MMEGNIIDIMYVDFEDVDNQREPPNLIDRMGKTYYDYHIIFAAYRDRRLPDGRFALHLIRVKMSNNNVSVICTNRQPKEKDGPVVQSIPQAGTGGIDWRLSKAFWQRLLQDFPSMALNADILPNSMTKAVFSVDARDFAKIKLLYL